MPITLFYRYKNGPEKVYHSQLLGLTIGRTNSSQPIDLDLSPDLRVSRAHARLFFDLSTWWIEDLESSNGTFLNSKRITDTQELFPGDQLRLGDTVLHVEFSAIDTNPGPGIREISYPVDEFRPSPTISEDRRVEILAKISKVASRASGQQEMLQGFMDELVTAFPSADRKTILLIDDRELVPCEYRPSEQAYVSFTLAREAIRTSEAFHWVSQITTGGSDPTADSLKDVVAALYSPIVFSGEVIGVVHIDTTSTSVRFSARDLQLLEIIANTMGPALAASNGDFLSGLSSIFVSYDPEERDFVNRLAADLRRRRVKVWFDERLQIGREHHKQLEIAIEATDAFVLILAPASLSSEQVKREMETALKLGKTVIPLMRKNCQMPEPLHKLVPFNLRAHHYSYDLDRLAEQLKLLSNRVAQGSEKSKQRLTYLPSIRTDSDDLVKIRRLLTNHFDDTALTQLCHKHFPTVYKRFGGGIDESVLDSSRPTQTLTQLREVLNSRFDEEELRTLCQDMDVDYDSLPAKGKSAKARELVKYLDRQIRLPQLVRVLRRSLSKETRIQLLLDHCQQNGKVDQLLSLTVNSETNDRDHQKIVSGS